MVGQNFLKFVFVFFQFGGMAFLMLTGPLFANNMGLLALELLGVFIGTWAIISMKLDNLRILPDLKEGAIFVKSGPYRLIRHPMYLSILTAFLPLVVNHYSIVRLLVFLIICIDLLLKLNYEEKILLSHFTGYQEYRKKTYRLLPFIY